MLKNFDKKNIISTKDTKKIFDNEELFSKFFDKDNMITAFKTDWLDLLKDDLETDDLTSILLWEHINSYLWGIVKENSEFDFKFNILRNDVVKQTVNEEEWEIRSEKSILNKVIENWKDQIVSLYNNQWILWLCVMTNNDNIAENKVEFFILNINK